MSNMSGAMLLAGAQWPDQGETGTLPKRLLASQDNCYSQHGGCQLQMYNVNLISTNPDFKYIRTLDPEVLRRQVSVRICFGFEKKAMAV